VVPCSDWLWPVRPLVGSMVKHGAGERWRRFSDDVCAENV
jgi:hypothetical protein